MARSDNQQFTVPLGHRICDKLDLPEDVCRNCGYVEIMSNTSALVEGCRGVLEYSDSQIKLSLRKLNVTFNGSSLTLRSLAMEQALVEGLIVSVEYSG